MKSKDLYSSWFRYQKYGLNGSWIVSCWHGYSIHSRGCKYEYIAQQSRIAHRLITVAVGSVAFCRKSMVEFCRGSVVSRWTGVVSMLNGRFAKNDFLSGAVLRCYPAMANQRDAISKNKSDCWHRLRLSMIRFSLTFSLKAACSTRHHNKLRRLGARSSVHRAPFVWGLKPVPLDSLREIRDRLVRDLFPLRGPGSAIACHRRLSNVPMAAGFACNAKTLFPPAADDGEWMPSSPIPTRDETRRMNRAKDEYLSRASFPFCADASKFETLVKIGQGTFGCVKYFTSAWPTGTRRAFPHFRILRKIESCLELKFW